MPAWQCYACGYLFDEPVPVRTVEAIRFVAPGDCTEDEYTDACPACGSTNIGNPTRGFVLPVAGVSFWSLSWMNRL